MTITADDKKHLRRCIDLASEAVERGDAPFGSLLVGADGTVLAERTNEVVTTADVTAHPELTLASWASRNLSEDERAAATMYTSGEHCAMCSAAHIWAGIGRLVFVLSGEHIRDLAGPDATTIDLGAREVVGRSNVDVQVDGPCEELADDAGELFDRR